VSPKLTEDHTVLYAVGIVELELESTSALILLLFVIPLAFTLSGFLLWIMYALNGVSYPIVLPISLLNTSAGTIAQLAARKQRFKLGMFRTLHRILLATSLVILAFFVVSSMTFSNRLAEGLSFSRLAVDIQLTRVTIKTMRPILGKFGGGFSTGG
jgi:hypothetical protein